MVSRSRIQVIYSDYSAGDREPGNMELLKGFREK